MDAKIFRRTKRWGGFYLLAVLSVSLILLALVAASGPAKAAPPASYKVGATAAFSSPPYSGWWRCGYKMAETDINDAGGINGHPLELIFEDNKADAITAVSITNKLIDYDKVPAMAGTTSTPVVSALPIANQKKTVFVNCAASSPKIRTLTEDWGFSVIPLATSEMVADAQFMYKELGFRKVAIILERTEQGIPGADAFEEEFKRLGGKVVKRVAYEKYAVDMRPQLLAIKAAKPDAVFCQSAAEDFGNLLAQAKEIGLIPGMQFFTFSVPIAQEAFKVAGDAAEGLIWSYFKYDPKAGTPTVKKWFDRFNLLYGYEPTMIYCATAYDSIMMVAKGIQKYGYSAEGIRRYLLEFIGKDYDGASGLINFDDHHVCKGSFVFRTYKNGKIGPYQR
jgi:branched-chain amino acid transport system substrate-binding protein